MTVKTKLVFNCEGRATFSGPAGWRIFSLTSGDFAAILPLDSDAHAVQARLFDLKPSYDTFVAAEHACQSIQDMVDAAEAEKNKPAGLEWEQVESGVWRAESRCGRGELAILVGTKGLFYFSASTDVRLGTDNDEAEFATFEAAQQEAARLDAATREADCEPVPMPAIVWDQVEPGLWEAESNCRRGKLRIAVTKMGNFYLDAETCIKFGLPQLTSFHCLKLAQEAAEALDAGKPTSAGVDRGEIANEEAPPPKPGRVLVAGDVLCDTEGRPVGWIDYHGTPIIEECVDKWPASMQPAGQKTLGVWSAKFDLGN